MLLNMLLGCCAKLNRLLFLHHRFSYPILPYASHAPMLISNLTQAL